MPPQKTTEPEPVKRALLYLRVSSKRQMDTAADIDPEGNSIPTQRLATQAKAKEIGCVVVDEYPEPGKSATSIAKRPIFQQMMQRIITHQDVDYVIVYQMSRAFRNATEELVTKAQLKQLGVQLISVKENFGTGYLADAMEGMLAIFNELQVRANGEDVKTKMLNKAMNGGTNSKAKLGYLNTKATVDGHKVNTIVVDRERAKYVVMAFELWASGRYATIEQLRDELTDAGLRMPETGQPISTQTLRKRLRDRYYIGFVTYKGIEYPGRHEPLISEELYDKAQVVLDGHSGTGTRQRTHHHYLKGTIWCGRCKSRFIVQRAKGNGGEYFYFLCRGTQQGYCDQPYVPVEVMEDAVTQHYARTVWLPAELRQQVRDAVDAALASHHGLSGDLRASLEAQIAKGERKESYLLDLAAEEDWPKEVLRQKIQVIRDERSRIRRQLEQTVSLLEAGRQVFMHALALLDDPHDMYQTGSETVRSILNRAFFSRLYIDGRKVTNQALREPFDVLGEAYTIYRRQRADRERPEGRDRQWRTYYRTGGSVALPDELAAIRSQLDRPEWLDRAQTAHSAGLLDEYGAAGDLHIPTAWDDDVRCLAVVFSGQGWSRDGMVDLTLQHTNHIVLIEGPEITVRPVSTITRASNRIDGAAGQHVHDEVLAQSSAVHRINSLAPLT